MSSNASTPTARTSQDMSPFRTQWLATLSHRDRGHGGPDSRRRPGADARVPRFLYHLAVLGGSMRMTGLARAAAIAAWLAFGCSKDTASESVTVSITPGTAT